MLLQTNQRPCTSGPTFDITAKQGAFGEFKFKLLDGIVGFHITVDFGSYNTSSSGPNFLSKGLSMEVDLATKPFSLGRESRSYNNVGGPHWQDATPSASYGWAKLSEDGLSSEVGGGVFSGVSVSAQHLENAFPTGDTPCATAGQ